MSWDVSHRDVVLKIEMFRDRSFSVRISCRGMKRQGWRDRVIDCGIWWRMGGSGDGFVLLLRE